MKDTVLKFVGWIGVNILGILIAKLSFRRIDCPNLANNPWFNSWLTFYEDDATGVKYFQIKYEYKSPYEKVLSYIQILNFQRRVKIQSTPNGFALKQCVDWQ